MGCGPTISIVVEDYDHVHHEHTPLHTKFEDTGHTYDESITMPGGVVVSSTSYTMTYSLQHYQQVQEPGYLHWWATLTKGYAGIWRWWAADSAALETGAWGVLMGEYDYSNSGIQSVLVDPYSVPAEGAAASALIFPYVMRAVGRVDNSDEVFVFWEQEFADVNEWADITGSVEIYDFFSEPVYIFSISIWQGTDAAPMINKYAMIYQGVMYLSDVFSAVPQVSFYDAYKVSIYGSHEDNGRYGYINARAAGMTIFLTDEDEIEQAEE
jgi:hypothetical protein